MPLKTLTLNRILDYLLVPLIAFVFSLKLFEYFNINLVLIVAAVIYLGRELLLENGSFKVQHLNILDYAVLLVVLIELLSYARSTYRPNGFQSLMEVSFLFLFYCLVRFNLKYEYQRLALIVFIALWAVTLWGVGLYFLLRLQMRLRLLEFKDLTDFRNQIWFINPVGLSIGEWLTVLFVMLPAPVILFIRFRHSRVARVITFLAVAATVFTIAITFNRGAYLALIASFIFGSALFYFYRIFSLKKILQFDVAMLALLFVALLPWARPTMTTLSIVKTTSQTRSLEARTSIWRDSLNIVKQHPILGIGANNFAMQYVAYDRTGGDNAFVLRPFNYFLQILIEKGVLGLLAYLFLLFSFLLVSHRKIKLLKGNVYRTSVVVCFVVAYAAVLVRDLSDSSILANRGANTLLWFMLAHNARLED
jgi:O-antigen ligase